MSKRALRSIFLQAAELQHPDSEHGSVFSCWNLQKAWMGHHNKTWANNIQEYHQSKEYQMYWKYMHPGTDVSIWWPRTRKSEWDFESRMLALLLCAEMLRR